MPGKPIDFWKVLSGEMGYLNLIAHHVADSGDAVYVCGVPLTIQDDRMKKSGFDMCIAELPGKLMAVL